MRRAVPGIRVIEAGIALERLGSAQLGDAVISCGLAGGLRDDLPTGRVVIPDAVMAPGGKMLECDPELVGALVRAAQGLGLPMERGPIVTSHELIAGRDRAMWAWRGFVAADMETGLIKAQRLAAVRVILDTPLRELSRAWLRPPSVIVRPWLWPQGLWLAGEGPRCARLAARIVALAFASSAAVGHNERPEEDEAAENDGGDQR